MRYDPKLNCSDALLQLINLTWMDDSYFICETSDWMTLSRLHMREEISCSWLKVLLSLSPCAAVDLQYIPGNKAFLFYLGAHVLQQFGLAFGCSLFHTCDLVKRKCVILCIYMTSEKSYLLNPSFWHCNFVQILFCGHCTGAQGIFL